MCFYSLTVCSLHSGLVSLSRWRDGFVVAHFPNVLSFLSLSHTHTPTQSSFIKFIDILHIIIYIYVCVCVCVCAFKSEYIYSTPDPGTPGRFVLYLEFFLSFSHTPMAIHLPTHPHPHTHTEIYEFYLNFCAVSSSINIFTSIHNTCVYTVYRYVRVYMWEYCTSVSRRPIAMRYAMYVIESRVEVAERS